MMPESAFYGHWRHLTKHLIIQAKIMFTLKFMKGNKKTVVAGARYDVTTDGIEQLGSQHRIVVYPQMTSDKAGVEFWVESSDMPNAFEVCFIENSAGKTIERLSASDR